MKVKTAIVALGVFMAMTFPLIGTDHNHPTPGLDASGSEWRWPLPGIPSATGPFDMPENKGSADQSKISGHRMFNDRHVLHRCISLKDGQSVSRRAGSCDPNALLKFGRLILACSAQAYEAQTVGHDICEQARDLNFELLSQGNASPSMRSMYSAASFVERSARLGANVHPNEYVAVANLVFAWELFSHSLQQETKPEVSAHRTIVRQKSARIRNHLMNLTRGSKYAREALFALSQAEFDDETQIGRNIADRYRAALPYYFAATAWSDEPLPPVALDPEDAYTVLDVNEVELLRNEGSMLALSLQD